MADEVYRTASPSNDAFKDFGLVRDICVESGATLGRPAISKQACRYTMEAVPPARDDGPPGCACAAGSRNENHRRADAAFVVVNAAMLVLDHDPKIPDIGNDPRRRECW